LRIIRPPVGSLGSRGRAHWCKHTRDR
jgi:hypothetical protein